MKAVGEVIWPSAERSRNRSQRPCARWRTGAGLGADGKGGEADASGRGAEDSWRVPRPSASSTWPVRQPRWTAERARRRAADPFFVARMADIVRVVRTCAAWRWTSSMPTRSARSSAWGWPTRRSRTSRIRRAHRAHVPQDAGREACVQDRGHLRRRVPQRHGLPLQDLRCRRDRDGAEDAAARHDSGAGPNRIGQASSSDYCRVHASYALHEAGFRRSW